MIPIRKPAIAAAALALSALTLTACSGADAGPAESQAPSAGQSTDAGNDKTSDAGSNDSGDGDVEGTLYDFDDLRVDDTSDVPPFVVDGPVTIQLSDELKAVGETAGSSIAVDGFTVKATAFSTGICRVDVDVHWADGGFEALGVQDEWSDWKKDRGPMLNAMDRVTNIGAEPVVVDELPSDDDLEKGKRYFTEDGTAFTRVGECSTEESGDLAAVMFPYVTPREHDNGGAELHLAMAGIRVVSGGQSGPDGATILLEGSVDADVSVTGEWVPPEY